MKLHKALLLPSHFNICMFNFRQLIVSWPFLQCLGTRRLCAILVVTNADGALVAEALGPEAIELDVGLGHVGVGEKEPEAEDDLGEDVEDGVGDDFSVDRGDARAVGDTPDAGSLLVLRLSL